MLVRELISKLHELQAKHEEHRYLNGEDMMGEADICIDVFAPTIVDHPSGPLFHYRGASREIKLEVSSDGVLNILSAFSESYPKEET